jgi:splicing factor 3B subunit 3
MDPLKDIVDGDLCEQFNSLDLAHQKAIADELDRPIPSLIKKMDQIKSKII